ncbi:hypothetical protein NP233_g1439 [Leucocoprinus birnbaumii]|uniref:G domain-containing protein n=1 Tax=Leucocoprinus birnbaumii TaxID=56174 RepID=A0AAD5W0I9_9AGAR|nr:hypothetical protein NP233_g1439 [Leucocoprinus birnbaumii]
MHTLSCLKSAVTAVSRLLSWCREVHPRRDKNEAASIQGTIGLACAQDMNLNSEVPEKNLGLNAGHLENISDTARPHDPGSIVPPQEFSTGTRTCTIHTSYEGSIDEFNPCPGPDQPRDRSMETLRDNGAQQDDAEATSGSCTSHGFSCSRKIQARVQHKFQAESSITAAYFSGENGFSGIHPIKTFRDARELKKNDHLVFVVGAAGAGKGTFIQYLLGHHDCGVEIEHSLRCNTSSIKAFRVTSTDTRKPNLILIDTPGFDDPSRSDEKTLTMILDWFKRSPIKHYHYEISPSIIYLHRITDSRIPGSVAKHFSLFKRICGPDFYDKVILITSMWPENDHAASVECHEREKRIADEYWSLMVAGGSEILRFMKSTDSAWHIVNKLISMSDHCRRDVKNDEGGPWRVSFLSKVFGTWKRAMFGARKLHA